MGIVPDVIVTISGRRSVREGFKKQAVSSEVVDDIVRCGLAAPSSKNAQPWRFHVVTSHSMLAELANEVQQAKDADRYVPIDPTTGRRRTDWPSTVAESAQILSQVPLGIFVENCGTFSSGRQAVAAASEDSRVSAVLGYSLEMVGLGAAIQNMWLAAHAHGLGGVFMGDVLIAEPVIRARLAIAGDLVGVLALGHAEAIEPFPKAMAEGRVVRHD